MAVKLRAYAIASRLVNAQAAKNAGNNDDPNNFCAVDDGLGAFELEATDLRRALLFKLWRQS